MFLENMVICTDEPAHGTVVEWLMTVWGRNAETLVLLAECLNFSPHAKNYMQSGNFII